ncbi:MAG TPA: ABC transporter substrate-binding protein [Vineibacter sp.]|nr:ABC transporter substrate-binding protein [Vineibacter sp.]
MRRREFIALGAAVVWPPAALAREPGKIYRIGWLTPTAGLPAEFRDALREVGWIEGTTLVFEVRQAEERRERLPDLASDLVRGNVDIIVAVAPAAIRAAKQATTTIPIVMAFWGGPDQDLIQSGIIASYARPGGNITGVQMLLYALNAKRLDLLHQAVPGAQKIAVLVPDRSPGNEVQLPPVRHVAGERGLELQIVDIREHGGYEGAFDAIVKMGPHALLVMDSPEFGRDRKLIIELAARKRVPAMHFTNDSARDGALIGYGVSRKELYRMAASFVDKILKGAKPADLPVEQPTKFELGINLKTAKDLGLTIPPTLLAFAHEVIE